MFRSKRGDLAKLLWSQQWTRVARKNDWNEASFWPHSDSGKIHLTSAQLSMLPEEIDRRQPPTYVCVSSLVNGLEGVSSRMIQQKNYPSIRNKLRGWCTVVSTLLCRKLRRCGGAAIEFVRQYIEQQKAPHEAQQRTPMASELSWLIPKDEV
ncbi:hypothetical protein [Burkholderia stagnalis]|uniref:hypothetical protein n=1 Tax=Burkholderia stagnalis TaxID=1503054 RepID=UPI001C89EFBC|nr:hypothetical protein [Burkholderia stagnalis]